MRRRESASANRAAKGALIGLVSSLALAAPPAAVAAKGKTPSRVTAVQVEMQLNTAAPTVIDATCPRGTRVVSGGFLGDSAQSGTSQPPGWAFSSRGIVTESRRLNRRTWRVTAIEMRNPDVPHGSGPNRAFSTAVCMPLRGGLIERTATGALSTSSSEPSTATATCPRQRGVVSGGFTLAPGPTPPFDYHALHESFRSSARGWTVSATPSTQPSIRVTTHAYCWKRPGAPQARATTQPYRGVSSPVCRHRESPIAGGVRSSAGTEILGMSPEVWDPRGSDPPIYERWRSAQATILFGPVVPLTMVSYCL
jgi:hypothetical protein